MDENRYILPEDATGMRIDAWLASAMGCSRSHVKSLLEKSLIRVRSGAEWEPFSGGSRHGVAGMEFSVEELPPPPGLVAQEIALDIVYEDADILVINKPAGLVVHPAPGHDDGTLVNALLHHCGDSLPTGNGEERPGIVHRLDQQTSGLLVVAKTDAAMEGLVMQFQANAVHKTYVALVHGIPRPAAGHIETLIGRSPTHRQKMAVLTEGGREAITDFRTVDIFLATNTAKLEVTIATGRTHQIRVHMKHLGYPVIGDPMYGNPKHDNALRIPHDRQMLHAQFLRFRHPVTDQELAFEAPLPDDMLSVCARLRG